MIRLALNFVFIFSLFQSYYDAMNPEESTSLPLRLRDKRQVVFGNLPEIHKFHETWVEQTIKGRIAYLNCYKHCVYVSLSVFIVCCRVFNEALQRYEEHPERVGECFIQFVSYCVKRLWFTILIWGLIMCSLSLSLSPSLSLSLSPPLPLPLPLPRRRNFRCTLCTVRTVPNLKPWSMNARRARPSSRGSRWT